MEKETYGLKEKISGLFWCFVIFSVLGMLTEMIFCFITTGVIESRQGLVWGPFCPIYGIGATIGIALLEPFKNNRVKLFGYGAIIGGVVEYFISYMLEAMYGTRFWDYTYLKFNLNGRICILYSIFWGILAIIVIRRINPLFQKLAIHLHKSFYMTVIEQVIFYFLLIDVVVTIFAINAYKINAKSLYYNKDYKSQGINRIIRSVFTDKYMLKVFPNMRFITEDGKEIYIREVIQ